MGSLRYVKTKHGKASYAVLIPSSGRSEFLRKQLTGKMQFLDRKSTFIGVGYEEIDGYRNALQDFNVTLVEHAGADNISFARNALKDHVRTYYDPQFYVVTDDNAYFDEDGLEALVYWCYRWTKKFGPNAMYVGLHTLKKFFHQNSIMKEACLDTCYSYENMAWIFMCFPAELYKKFTYDNEFIAWDDKWLGIWLTMNGYKSRACIKAPFTKARHQPGGSGSNSQRILRQAHDAAALYNRFPEIMGHIHPRIPWKHLMSLDGQDVLKSMLEVGVRRRKKFNA